MTRHGGREREREREREVKEEGNEECFCCFDEATKAELLQRREAVMLFQNVLILLIVTVN